MNINLIFGSWMAGANMLLYAVQKYPISILANAANTLILDFLAPLGFSALLNNRKPFMKPSLTKKLLPAKITQNPAVSAIYHGTIFAVPFIVNSNLMYKITNVLTRGLTMKGKGNVTLFGRVLHSIVTGLLFTTL